MNEIKQAKLNFEQRQIDKINNFAPGSSRSWWQTVKVFFLSKSKRSSIPSVQLSNGNVTNYSLLKATMFINFFKSNSNLDTANPTLPPIHYDAESRLNSIKCCEQEKSDILKSIDPNKASGADGISPRMLKYTPSSIYPSVTPFNIFITYFTVRFYVWS